MRPSAGMLARGRAMNEANLPDTAVAEVPTPGIDDGEGGTLPGEPVTFSFPCRVVLPGSDGQREVPFADALKLPGSIMLAYSLDVTLPTTAEVTVHRQDGTALRYDVAGVVPLGSYSVVQRAVLKLTTQEITS